MKKSLAWLGLLVSALVAFACVSTNTTVMNRTLVRKPILSQDVVLYRTADQVPGKYEEIALLNSRGDTVFSNEAQLFRSMKKKAARVGANGIILDALREPSDLAKVAAAFFVWSPLERKGKAIAIYVYPPQE